MLLSRSRNLYAPLPPELAPNDVLRKSLKVDLELLKRGVGFRMLVLDGSVVVTLGSDQDRSDGPGAGLNPRRK